MLLENIHLPTEAAECHPKLNKSVTVSTILDKISSRYLKASLMTGVFFKFYMNISQLM